MTSCTPSGPAMSADVLDREPLDHRLGAVPGRWQAQLAPAGDSTLHDASAGRLLHRHAGSWGGSVSRAPPRAVARRRLPCRQLAGSSTAPVKRGAAVRKKLLCQVLTVPTNLGVITVPPPDPDQDDARALLRPLAATRRAPAATPSSTPSASPWSRSIQSEGTAPPRTASPSTLRASCVNAGDATGTFANGVELVNRLADAKIVKALSAAAGLSLCRRPLGRRRGGDVLSVRPGSAERGPTRRCVELLVDWVRSDSFMTRRVQ